LTILGTSSKKSPQINSRPPPSRRAFSRAKSNATGDKSTARYRSTPRPANTSVVNDASPLPKSKNDRNTRPSSHSDKLAIASK